MIKPLLLIGAYVLVLNFKVGAIKEDDVTVVVPTSTRLDFDLVSHDITSSSLQPCSRVRNAARRISDKRIVEPADAMMLPCNFFSCRFIQVWDYVSEEKLGQKHKVLKRNQKGETSAHHIPPPHSLTTVLVVEALVSTLHPSRVSVVEILTLISILGIQAGIRVKTCGAIWSR